VFWPEESLIAALFAGVLQDHIQNAPFAIQLCKVHVVNPAARHNFYAGGVTVNVYSGDLTTAFGAPVPANLVPDTPGLTPTFVQQK